MKLLILLLVFSSSVFAWPPDYGATSTDAPPPDYETGAQANPPDFHAAAIGVVTDLLANSRIPEGITATVYNMIKSRMEGQTTTYAQNRVWLSGTPYKVILPTIEVGMAAAVIAMRRERAQIRCCWCVSGLTIGILAAVAASSITFLPGLISMGVEAGQDEAELNDQIDYSNQLIDDLNNRWKR